MSVVDFSKWNDLPWWIRNGYKTCEEAWGDYRNQNYCTDVAYHARCVAEFKREQREKHHV